MKGTYEFKDYCWEVPLEMRVSLFDPLFQQPETPVAAALHCAVFGASLLAGCGGGSSPGSPAPRRLFRTAATFDVPKPWVEKSLKSPLSPRRNTCFTPTRKPRASVSSTFLTSLPSRKAAFIRAKARRHRSQPRPMAVSLSPF
jgi:hypothetical protein